MHIYKIFIDVSKPKRCIAVVTNCNYDYSSPRFPMVPCFVIWRPILLAVCCQNKTHSPPHTSTRQILGDIRCSIRQRKISRMSCDDSSTIHSRKSEMDKCERRPTGSRTTSSGIEAATGQAEGPAIPDCYRDRIPAPFLPRHMIPTNFAIVANQP